MLSFTTRFASLLFTGLLISLHLQAQDAAPADQKPGLFFPAISIGTGMMKFNGDIGFKKVSQPLLSRTAMNLEVQLLERSGYSFHAFLLSGQLFGENNELNRMLNFNTSLLAQGVLFRYEFHSRKREDQVLFPFVAAGIEMLNFTTKSDLKDANGRPYHYWSDGSIRDKAQTDSSASDAIRLFRDYKYETDLRDANLDGQGKYKQRTVAIPVGIGVRFRISENSSLLISSTMHLSQTDHLDGISSNGVGNRKGDNKNDKFVYSSVSFRYSFGVERESKRAAGDYRDVDFRALELEDSDGDGIPDMRDDSSMTPHQQRVDASGKPLDRDNDGIPDYRDLEPNSPKNALVNEDGVTITEAMIEEKFRKDSLAALPAVMEIVRSYDRLNKQNPDLGADDPWSPTKNKAGQAPIPVLYRPLDVDDNGVITPREISDAIDVYMAGKSAYSVQEFFDLIDFFFQQR